MIDIVVHRPSWHVEFRELGLVLRRGLGEAALRIDHIGSTSVPELRAKDIIDIQITVEHLESSVCSALQRLGYEQHRDVSADHVPPHYAGPKTDWEKFVFTQPAGRRRVNVHVRQAGRPNQRYALLFRDYLASHPSVAAAYGELKSRLAASLASEADYPDVKDPAVDMIYFAAQEWAASAQWQLGPSDA